MQHIAENVAYGVVWLATGEPTGRYGTSAGVHLAAGGLHLAAQGLHIQHMAVYAAYGCWLAGHRGHTDLRGYTHWRVKCRTGGPNNKEHYCKQ